MEETSIVTIVQSVVFLTPIAVMIWNMSKLHSRIERNKADIDGLGKKIREIVEEDSKTIKSINERLLKVEKDIVIIGAGSEYIKKEIGEMKEILREIAKGGRHQ